MIATPPDVPRPYADWLAESGPAGLRHALAEAVGDADTRWRHTGLPLFDPAGRGGPRLPPVADPASIYARLHPARREQGVFYTPGPIADAVTALAWNGSDDVLDPACGAGEFLLAALRALPASGRADFALERLHGTDLDPLAVMLAQARIAGLVHLEGARAAQLCARVRCADALAAPFPAVGFVLTNPPFLNRLRTRTAGDPSMTAARRAQFGPAVGPYTDTSVVFLLASWRAARRGVGIVLPASVCATRDSARVREECGAPAWLWTLPADRFDGVRTPLVAAGFSREAPTTRVRRSFGDPPAPLPDGLPTAAWGALLHSVEAPPWTPTVGAGGTLGDHTRIEADFRDEYYALAGHIVEDGPGLRVVTSGQIEPGRLGWGERPSRIHRQAWLRPTVVPEALHPRQGRREGPRVLVATQTRILEAVADLDGRCVGLTPVITVLPAPLDALDILAILLSPPASAWARGRGTGGALSLRAMKLSAADLRALPMPPSVPPEARALAVRLTAGDPTALLPLADAMNAAWGAPPSLLSWWRTQADLPSPA